MAHIEDRVWRRVVVEPDCAVAAASDLAADFEFRPEPHSGKYRLVARLSHRIGMSEKRKRCDSLANVAIFGMLEHAFQHGAAVKSKLEECRASHRVRR